MAFTTKVDYTRQVKQGPGEIAVFSGSTTILGDLDVYGRIMSGGTDISTLWGSASSGTNKYVTSGSLDGSYELTLDYNDGGTATPISLSALSDNVIVKYANGLAEMKAAFNEFNAPPATAGVVKLAGNVTLTGDTTLDFGTGIELWGGGNAILLDSSTNKIIVHGSRATFRNIAIVGNRALTTGVVNSQQCIEIDDASMSTFKMIECRITDVVGTTTGAYSASTTAPIHVANCAIWSSFEFLFLGIGTQASGVQKLQGPLYVFWSPGGSGTKFVFKDAYNSSPENFGTATRFERYRNSLQVRIDGATSTTFQNQVIYDETLTIDAASTWPNMDLYPNMYGASIVLTPNDPITVATYGVPGDIIVTGNTLYMKAGDIGSDTDWITLLDSSTQDPIKIGRNANILGSSNSTIAIGENAGEDSSAIGSPNNILIGKNAGSTLTTGRGNVFIGTESGGGNSVFASVTFNNVAIGLSAMTSVNHFSAFDNVAIGHNALAWQQRGSGNVAIGNNTGLSLSTGVNDGNILIGSGVDGPGGGVDDIFALGRSATTLLHGNFQAVGRTKLGINLGVGWTTPTATLDIKSGGSLATTDALHITDSSSNTLFHIQDDGKIGQGTNGGFTNLDHYYTMEFDVDDLLLHQIKNSHDGNSSGLVRTGFQTVVEYGGDQKGALWQYASTGWTGTGTFFNVDDFMSNALTITTTGTFRGTINIGTRDEDKDLRLFAGAGTGSGGLDNGNIRMTLSGTETAANDSIIILHDLPTVVTALPTGALWNNGGVINVAP